MEQVIIKRKKKRALNWRENYFGWIYCLPMIIGIAVFTLTPILLSIYSMFLDWSGYISIFEAEVVGFRNFIDVFSGVFKTNFFGAMLNTLYMMLNIPITLILGMLLAMGMNRKMVGAKTFRVLYYLPSITSVVAITILFQKLFAYDGTVNMLVLSIGGSKIEWLTDSVMIKVTVNILLIWKGVGYTSLMYLAGLQSVPKDQLEAASMDGAGSIMRFYKITLPALYPITFYLLVTSIINGLQLFNEPFILVKYGPANSAMTLGSFVYYYYKSNMLGVAAVGAWVLAIIVFIVTSMQISADNKREII